LTAVFQNIFAAALLLFSTQIFAEVDHGLFDSVLKAHTKDGQVDYPAVAADKAFSTYLDQLATTPAPSAKNEKLVYYMNAYNALAMKGILDGKSPSNFFGRHTFFKSTKFKIAGGENSLHNIEHEILRKLDEPRIHFSIVCASSSCPKIRSDAYTVAKLEEQLDDNARRFVNDTSRNRFDKKEKLASISQIFKWFAEDFEKSAGNVQKYISKYVNDPDVAKEMAAEGYKTKYLDYSWNLNGTAPK
jgi:Protein of unknown function, DUF547